ncbi:hypothetical protein QF011_003382 [Curtobacterium flaccumfaciens]|nr:hypothetical protein [Curtobacterium flaccumfaciens]MDQ0540804.1 hypothetical protein [Curtobacterium flaccumfaciens]
MLVIPSSVEFGTGSCTARFVASATHPAKRCPVMHEATSGALAPAPRARDASSSLVSPRVFSDGWCPESDAL